MTSRVLVQVWLLGTALSLGLILPSVSQAQDKPDNDNGRYSLSQSSDGFVRLDNRTGAISNCANKGTGWACYSTPDESAVMDSEIGRLQAESARLKAELAKRDNAAASLGDENAKLKAELAKRDNAIGSVGNENAQLKAELAKKDAELAKRDTATGSVGKIDEPLPKSDSEKPAKAADNKAADNKTADNKPADKAPLRDNEPAEKADRGSRVAEVERRLDRVKAFLQQAWNRLVELAGQVRREALASDKI